MPISQTVELPDLPRGPASSTLGRDMPGALPLRGVTVLAVEDSRFASDALRLMCRRLGARLRRAESIHAAQSHLKLYRPTVVIVDLGLPDGRGEALIREIVARGAAGPVVLGTSGDATGRASALAAGAVGFLDKPLESFAAFHAALAPHLPDQIAPVPDADAPLAPDSLALRDDLAHAAALIEAGTDAQSQQYLSGFLAGVARHAHDTDLAEAAQRAGAAPQPGPQSGFLADPQSGSVADPQTSPQSGQQAGPQADRFDQLRQMLAGRLASSATAFGEASPPKS